MLKWMDYEHCQFPLKMVCRGIGREGEKRTSSILSKATIFIIWTIIHNGCMYILKIDVHNLPFQASEPRIPNSSPGGSEGCATAATTQYPAFSSSTQCGAYPGGETSNIFHFHPYWGKISNLTTVIFF